MKSFIPKHWKAKLTILIGCAGFLYFWWYMGYGCIFQSYFNIQCPGCGLTRAWLSVLSGNWKAAFNYHTMFWSVPILELYLIYDIELFKNHKLNYSLLILILLGWFLNYFLKLFLL